jgi:hypothetical protein
MERTVLQHWVHFLNVYLFLAGPEGFERKTSERDFCLANVVANNSNHQKITKEKRRGGGGGGYAHSLMLWHVSW